MALRMDQGVYRCGFATIENFDSFDNQVYDYAQLLLGLFLNWNFMLFVIEDFFLGKCFSPTPFLVAYSFLILWPIFNFLVKCFFTSIFSELIVSNLRKSTKFLQHYYITWFLCWLLWLNFNHNRQSTKMSLVKIDQSFATQIWLHLFFK
jgi:hypothetical protein